MNSPQGFVRRRPSSVTGLVVGILLSGAMSASAAPEFREIASSDLRSLGYPASSRFFDLELAEIQAFLAQAPAENFAAPVPGLAITLPLPEGGAARFEVWETPILHPDLAAQFPEIKTYAGRGLDDRRATVRLDTTPHGFHAMIRSLSPTVFIDPIEVGNPRTHVSHFKRAGGERGTDEAFTCEMISTPEVEREIEQLVQERRARSTRSSIGTQLRTYRTAVAATGEYTTYHGGTVALGLAAITTSVNRVSGIYEQELSIRMQLIANNNLIVYTNGATDPYTNNNGGTMLGQNQANLDAVIGTANYDHGHVFSTGGGGIANLAVTCRVGQKARGVTGSPQPIGDNFDVDYVAHEMGHQFGATHSFNGNSGACSGNRTATTAYEPGSGSTIMSYAGICGGQNLQPHSDPEFHGASFDQIVAYSQSGPGNNCPVITATGNTPPAATAGNAGLTIPISTPFILYGVGSDADGDPITYSWEEFDLGPAGHPNTPSGNAPIFRSWSPKDREWRMFPRRVDVRNNTATIGEILPTYTRTLTFRLTVRDNLGGVSDDQTSLAVDDRAGPFVLTSIDATPWQVGSPRTITWDVAGTDASPISCTNVNILLSTDDGENFPYTLAANTPNDGSEMVVVPAQPTTLARVLVEAEGNLFFDMNDDQFEISGSAVSAGEIASKSTGPALEVQPNPFSSQARITFSISRPGPVQLTVYNAVGRRVSTLLNSPREAGVHTIEWNGYDESGTLAAPGVYFVRLESADEARTTRSLLLR
jgi:hypothetical protein